jgi:hypothetical protein
VNEELVPTYDQVVRLTRWMADRDFTSDEVAYAVEKPWKHTDYWAECLSDEEFDQIVWRLMERS